MTASQERRPSDVWDQIDKDKRDSRLLRRVIVVAWSVVFLMVLIFAVVVVYEVIGAWRIWLVGGVPYTFIIDQLMPLVFVVGVLSLLIATLSTIGAFVRSRVATLAEIQLRLAALESILRAQPDEPRPR